MTWTTMRDLDTGTIVNASDMDAIRTNIEHLYDYSHDIDIITSSATTSSTSMADISGYELSVDTTGGPLFVFFQALITDVSNSYATYFDCTVDGTSILGGTYVGTQKFTAGYDTLGWQWVIVPSAGTHTIKMRWSVQNASISPDLYGSVSYPSLFAAIGY